MADHISYIRNIPIDQTQTQLQFHNMKRAALTLSSKRADSLERSWFMQTGAATYLSIPQQCGGDDSPRLSSQWAAALIDATSGWQPLEAEGSAKPRRLISPCDHNRRLLNVLSTWRRLPTPFLSCLLLPLNYFACVDNCRTRRLGLLRKINPARLTSRVVFFVFFFNLHASKNNLKLVITAALFTPLA